MKKGLILAVVLVLALSLGAFAFQNEPEGFRGLKWGDPPGEDMKVNRIFKLYQDKLDMIIWYTRQGDELKIGGAKLEGIYYGFYKNKFMRVEIETEDYELLREVLYLKFGEPTYRGTFKVPSLLFKRVMEYMSETWDGDTTKIHLVESSIYNPLNAGLDIHCTESWSEFIKDRRQKEEEIEQAKEEERQKAAEEGLDDF